MSETRRPKLLRQGRKRKLAIRVAVWLGIGVLVLLGLLYVRLLFGPISLDFLSDRVQSEIASIVEDDYVVDWQDFGLSLTGPVSLGFHLSTVTLTERASNATISADALELSVSPIGAAMGRPEARIRLIEPQIQMVQDLLNPRLSRLEFREDAGTGETVVRILEGEHSSPNVTIGDTGLSLGTSQGAHAIGLRSESDWLALNIKALDVALADLADQALAGQITRVEIIDGSVGVLDTVYNLYREFDDVDLEVRSGREDGRVSALFSAQIAGKTMDGSILRHVDGEEAVIEAEVHNMDFSTLIPFLDDATGLAALRGSGALDLGVRLSAQTGEVISGAFAVDLSGTHLRLNQDLFEISAQPLQVEWVPDQALFSLAETEITIGQSRGTISGDFVMGFDAQFGPTLGMSIRAHDIWLHPQDLDAPSEPFDLITFEGWSAPLYGAIGVDRFVAGKDEASLVMQGRIDMVNQGVGMDLTMSGRNATADDVKRLWPYLFAPEGREWFTHYIEDGRVSSAEMAFNCPVGSVNIEGKGGPVPEGSMTIDIVGHDLDLIPLDGMPEFETGGNTTLTIRDNQLTVALDSATLPQYPGLRIANAAYLNQDTAADAHVFDVSGDLTGPAEALLRLVGSESFDLLEGMELGFDIGSLAESIKGNIETTVIGTLTLDEAGAIADTDYTLNGNITDLAGTAPFMGFDFADAGFSFTASQQGFRVLGSGLVEDVDVDVQAIKAGTGEPEILIGATLDVEDAAAFGVDLSDYMAGSIRVVGKPLADGRFGVSADLTDAALTVSDIGISKARGDAGSLMAEIEFGEDQIAVSEVDFSFGSVRLGGAIDLSAEGELLSADFSTFQISEGDSASVTMTPIDGGYAFAIEGQQLDLKPVLRRFFNLEGGTEASASEDLEDQLFAVSVELDRALGHYGEAAFNVDLNLAVRGDQLRRLHLAMQFAGNRSASATTNPLPSGRIISYGTNDLGAMMRFTGVYPRLVGGEGSMVMRYDQGSNADAGEFVIRNFAVVDEQNLDAIVGQHDESRQVIGGASAMEFDYGRAEFIRYSDRIQLVDAAVYGDMVGGTVRGNIMTQSGRYDLAGTYVPLFGLNNFFQQIPILGPIFGGREGEGLIGVTFAVRGPLNQPELLINPVSILAPGVFRSLFEYRAANQAPPAAR